MVSEGWSDNDRSVFSLYQGCYSAFIAFLSDNIKVVGGVCVGVAVLMVSSMVSPHHPCLASQL